MEKIGYDCLLRSRTPFHTTVDIGTLKYFKPRVDKIYITQGSVDDEQVAANKLEVGEIYKIIDVGNTTDFDDVGAASNTQGVIFRATGAATGTGLVTKAEGNVRVLKFYNNSNCFCFTCISGNFCSVI